ncbi:hypothetical protein BO94DRAFT_356935 [Aspergillus sclerotioniger CBS 115572]|uniref:Uncharacterized protein n=1 Tax=Aspergillus sclerotioniger CBS 115572 TaxID=1450535 RepID=A0A317UUN4_9EURO|nr:hypothetical protein BO94DRAFT_356935 [Aspergillus sclerotioniger CBS 115572]PWY64788.1 hypothetical protein BO94DRAFT_356935 [Aspergillus sclerotioniger CBS 115572]
MFSLAYSAYLIGPYMKGGPIYQHEPILNHKSSPFEAPVPKFASYPLVHPLAMRPAPA